MSTPRIPTAPPAVPPPSPGYLERLKLERTRSRVRPSKLDALTGRLRAGAGRIVRSSAFRALSVSLVLCSTVFLALDRPLDEGQAIDERSVLISDEAFALLFALELGLRIAALEPPFGGAARRGYDVLDAVVVAALLAGVAAERAGATMWVVHVLHSFRALRLFRALANLRALPGLGAVGVQLDAFGGSLSLVPALLGAVLGAGVVAFAAVGLEAFGPRIAAHPAHLAAASPTAFASASGSILAVAELASGVHVRPWLGALLEHASLRLALAFSTALAFCLSVLGGALFFAIARHASDAAERARANGADADGLRAQYKLFIDDRSRHALAGYRAPHARERRPAPPPAPPLRGWRAARAALAALIDHLRARVGDGPAGAPLGGCVGVALACAVAGTVAEGAHFAAGWGAAPALLLDGAVRFLCAEVAVKLLLLGPSHYLNASLWNGLDLAATAGGALALALGRPACVVCVRALRALRTLHRARVRTPVLDAAALAAPGVSAVVAVVAVVSVTFALVSTRLLGPELARRVAAVAVLLPPLPLDAAAGASGADAAGAAATAALASSFGSFAGALKTFALLLLDRDAAAVSFEAMRGERGGEGGAARRASEVLEALLAASYLLLARGLALNLIVPIAMRALARADAIRRGTDGGRLPFVDPTKPRADETAADAAAPRVVRVVAQRRPATAPAGAGAGGRRHAASGAADGSMRGRVALAVPMGAAAAARTCGARAAALLRALRRHARGSKLVLLGATLGKCARTTVGLLAALALALFALAACALTLVGLRSDGADAAAPPSLARPFASFAELWLSLASISSLKGWLPILCAVAPAADARAAPSALGAAEGCTGTGAMADALARAPAGLTALVVAHALLYLVVAKVFVAVVASAFADASRVFALSPSQNVWAGMLESAREVDVRGFARRLAPLAPTAGGRGALGGALRSRAFLRASALVSFLNVGTWLLLATEQPVLGAGLVRGAQAFGAALAAAIVGEWVAQLGSPGGVLALTSSGGLLDAAAVAAVALAAVRAGGAPDAQQTLACLTAAAARWLLRLGPSLRAFGLGRAHAIVRALARAAPLIWRSLLLAVGCAVGFGALGVRLFGAVRSPAALAIEAAGGRAAGVASFATLGDALLLLFDVTLSGEWAEHMRQTALGAEGCVEACGSAGVAWAFFASYWLLALHLALNLPAAAILRAFEIECDRARWPVAPAQFGAFLEAWLAMHAEARARRRAGPRGVRALAAAAAGAVSARLPLWGLPRLLARVGGREPAWLAPTRARGSADLDLGEASEVGRRTLSASIGWQRLDRLELRALLAADSTVASPSMAAGAVLELLIKRHATDITLSADELARWEQQRAIALAWACTAVVQARVRGTNARRELRAGGAPAVRPPAAARGGSGGAGPRAPGGGGGGFWGSRQPAPVQPLL
jgi:hypothetical protein